VVVGKKLELKLIEEVGEYSECSNSKLSATANKDNKEFSDFGQKFESVSSQTKRRATTTIFLE
jgi:hypothetical protein